ncbi:MAG: phytanoyl-CoA dioxygenase family protein [Spirulinaceae cyanobacterium]
MEPSDQLDPETSLDKPSYHLTDLDQNIEYKIKAKKIISDVLEPHLPEILDNYKIITTNFIIKPPGKGKFNVHQDWTFVSDTRNYTSLTLWCPLVDTNEENGTLQVVEASHKLVPDIATSTVDFYCKKFEDAVIKKYGKPLCLKAGKCVVFDHSLLHFSGDNHSNRSRYVMQVILVPHEIEPVFYYFDVNQPEKGFEVFQIKPDFFVFQNFQERPSNLKSLGFIKNENKFITEADFIKKLKKNPQEREELVVFDYKSNPLMPEGLVEFMNPEVQEQIKENSQIKKNLGSLFNLLRGNDWWFYKIPPLLAIAYGEILRQGTLPQQSITTLLALLVSMFFVAAYGHVVNDIFDIQVDALAGKENRMAPLQRGQRILLSLGLAVAGVIPWWFIGFDSIPAVSLAAIYILLSIYPAPPLRLKERYIWGAVADAATVHAIPTLLVATVFSRLGATLQAGSNTLVIVATAWAFAVGMRGVLLHQIWDRENDLKSDVKTLATKFGEESLRTGINYLVFPFEAILCGGLVILISQTEPWFLVPCTVYLGLLFFSTRYDEFDPSPSQKAYVILHDFYEVWLPLSLLALLSVREPKFLILLALHITLFYPAIKQRLLVSVRSLAGKLKKLNASNQENQGSTPKSPAQQPGETFLESPSTDLEHRLAKSVRFLAENQLDDGEFPTYEDADGKLSKFDSSPFATSLILYSLSFLRPDDSENKVKHLIDKGLQFLRQEMEFGGLWRYWSSNNPKHLTIPPDLDDISCISYILRANNIPFTDNTGFVLANQTKIGAFYTWILPRSIKSILLNVITFGKALSSSEAFWKITVKSDVCCAVNSNVLLYLGERKETQNCIKYLIEVIQNNEEYQNTEFYLHNLSFYYMLSRAYYNGVKSLNVVKSLVIHRVLTFQQNNGSFGDVLLTALGVCTLLNLNYVSPRIDEAINFILNKQNPEGYWKRIAMFGGKTTQHFFGSEALTTGFCVEALARYRLLNLTAAKRETVNPLTPQMRKGLKEYSYVILDNFLSETELEDLQEFDSTHPLPKDIETLSNSTNINSSNASYRQKVNDHLKAIVNPKLTTLLPNYRATFCTWYRKSSNSSINVTQLHQDPSLTSEPDTLSYGIWCPLIDVAPGNGCLHIIKGSHHLNSKPRPFYPFSPFPYSDDIATLLTEQYLTPIPLKAGQAILYDKRLFHSATANPTDTERVAFTCLICPSDKLTQFVYRPTPNAETIEIHEVPDDFYNRYILGDKPSGEGVNLIKTEPYTYDPLTPELIAEKLNPLHPQKSTPQPEVIKQYRQALQHFQEQAKHHIQQLQTQLQQTQTKLAHSESQLQTTKTELTQLQSYLQQTQGEEGIINYYRHRLTSDPDDIQLYYQALTIKSNDIQLHQQLGNALARQNRFTDAIASYQTALQHQPHNWEIHVELGKAFEKEQKWADAIAIYQRMIELNPNHVLGYQKLGDLLAQQGQINEASFYYHSALRAGNK